MRSRRAVAAAWAALLGLSACAELPTVTPGVCGNGVVETGEDCDDPGGAGKETGCGQRTEPSACRLECASDADCPTGADTGDWRCGLDAICRRVHGDRTAADAWSPGVPVAATPGRDILVADLDGDGLNDIVSVAPPRIEVFHADEGRSLSAGDTLYTSGPRVSLGLLSDHPDRIYGPSILAEVSGGLGIYTGESDRTLSVKPYATLTLSAGSSGPAPSLEPFHHYAPQQPGVPLGPTMFVGFNNAAIGVLDVAEFQFHVQLLPADTTPMNRGLVRRFAALPCDQFAVATGLKTAPSDAVQVWSPCDADGPLPTQMISDPPLAEIATVAFAPSPGGKRRFCTDCQPIHVAHLNGDPWPDLILIDGDFRPHVAFAAQDGSGQFGSDPQLPDGLAAPYLFPLDQGQPVIPFKGAPLAIGDLNGDCALDFVDAHGIHVSYGLGKAACNGVTTPKQYQSTSGQGPIGSWTEASFADVNRDGVTDVVALSRSAIGVSVYLGTGTGLWNQWSLVTSSPTKGLTIGDFDGDRVDDIVYVELGGSTDGGASNDALFVSFGETSGGPTEPALMGEIAGVGQVTSTFHQITAPDLVNDLFVAAQPEPMAATSIYLFPGASTRQLDAPFFLIEPSSHAIDLPVGVVAGWFGGRSVVDDDGEEVMLGDLAVHARRHGCSGSGCAQLWLVPTTKHADIVPLAATGGAPEGQAINVPMPAGVDGAADLQLMNVGPSSDGGVDELLIVAAGASGVVTSLVSCAAGEEGFLCESSAAAEIDFGMIGANGSAGRVLAADTTGDGLREVVLASTSSDGGLAVITRDPARPHGIGAARMIAYETFDGSVCVDGAMVASPPPAKSKPGISVASIWDGVNAREVLVVVARRAVYLVTDDGQTLDIACTNLPGGNAVAAGDFDGDGVDDLAIGDDAGIVVYYGEPAAPGDWLHGGGTAAEVER